MKASEIDKKWYVVDADNLVLGRLASQVAMRLRGKHKPTFTPNMDCGDHIIIINAEKVCLTGKKYSDKLYHKHTGYVGGLKTKTAREIIEGDFPERVLEKAVQRMLPKGVLGKQIFKNLRVYTGADHPHTAQAPEKWDIGTINRKNKGL